MKKWEILLPTVELVINSLPNSSTDFSPFFLNYRYELVTPIQLLRGDEVARTESVASFAQRVASDWNLARENLDRSVRLQAKYYDKKHRDVGYEVGDLVLLSTRNLKMKGTLGKLQKRFRIFTVHARVHYRETHTENKANATRVRQTNTPRSARKETQPKALHNNVQNVGSSPTVPSPNPAHTPVCLALPLSLSNPVWSPLTPDLETS